MKKVIISVLAILMTLSCFVTAHAGQWKQDYHGWWYQNDNGTYPRNTWQYINGAWYCFDGAGYMLHDTWSGNYYLGSDGAMLTNKMTPDGYYVGADGRWDGLSNNGNQGSYIKTISYDDIVVLSSFVDKGSYYEADATVYDGNKVRYYEMTIVETSPHINGKIRFRKDASFDFYDFYGGTYGADKGLKHLRVSDNPPLTDSELYKFVLDNDGYVISFYTNNGA